MKILIAEDDNVSSTVLQRMLITHGHEPIVTRDGREAWEILQRDDAPKIAILDWMMPELDGAELCRRVKGLARRQPTHIIMVTAKSQKEDIVLGLESGADDYVTKPYSLKELSARIQVGERIVRIQQELCERIVELERTAAKVNELSALLAKAGIAFESASSQAIAT